MVGRVRGSHERHPRSMPTRSWQRWPSVTPARTGLLPVRSRANFSVHDPRIREGYAGLLFHSITSDQKGTTTVVEGNLGT